MRFRVGKDACFKSGGSKGGMKIGGLKGPYYMLYYIEAYFRHLTFLHPKLSAL